MRLPTEVAEKIKVVVPEHHKGAFHAMYKNFCYKAPEQSRDCFLELFELVQDILKEENGTEHPNCKWQFEMCAILSDKTVEDIENHYK